MNDVLIEPLGNHFPNAHDNLPAPIGKHAYVVEKRLSGCRYGIPQIGEPLSYRLPNRHNRLNNVLVNPSSDSTPDRPEGLGNRSPQSGQELPHPYEEGLHRFYDVRLHPIDYGYEDVLLYPIYMGQEDSMQCEEGRDDEGGPTHHEGNRRTDGQDARNDQRGVLRGRAVLDEVDEPGDEHGHTGDYEHYRCGKGGSEDKVRAKGSENRASYRQGNVLQVGPMDDDVVDGRTEHHKTGDDRRYRPRGRTDCQRETRDHQCRPGEHPYEVRPVDTFRPCPQRLPHEQHGTCHGHGDTGTFGQVETERTGYLPCCQTSGHSTDVRQQHHDLPGYLIGPTRYVVLEAREEIVGLQRYVDAAPTEGAGVDTTFPKVADTTRRGRVAIIVLCRGVELVQLIEPHDGVLVFPYLLPRPVGLRTRVIDGITEVTDRIVHVLHVTRVAAHGDTARVERRIIDLELGIDTEEPRDALGEQADGLHDADDHGEDHVEGGDEQVADGSGRQRELCPQHTELVCGRRDGTRHVAVRLRNLGHYQVIAQGHFLSLRHFLNTLVDAHVGRFELHPGVRQVPAQTAQRLKLASHAGLQLQHGILDADVVEGRDIVAELRELLTHHCGTVSRVAHAGDKGLENALVTCPVREVDAEHVLNLLAVLARALRVLTHRRFEEVHVLDIGVDIPNGRLESPFEELVGGGQPCDSPDGALSRCRDALERACDPGVVRDEGRVRLLQVLVGRCHRAGGSGHGTKGGRQLRPCRAALADVRREWCELRVELAQLL